MGLKDNLSSMYDSAANSAKNFGNRAMETAKDVSENEVFKAVVFDKDDPVDVALTAAGAVTGGASIGAKAIYKGAKIAKAASNVFKSEKVADTALTIGKKIGSGAEAAKDIFSKGSEAVSGKLSQTSEAAKNVFSKGSEYLGKKVEQGKEAASKIVSEGMEKASEITTKAKESATDIFKRGRDVATEKVEQAKDSAKNLFKREPKTKTSKEKFDDFFGKKSSSGKTPSSKTFKRLAGVSALGGGIAAIKNMFDKTKDDQTEDDQDVSEITTTSGVITGTGKISPSSTLTPNITPPENIETSAAEMTPIGEGGAGGLGDARSILEKIYMVLQQTHRTVEKISIDTGNLVRYSSMKDVSADLASANAMARIGEGVAYGGGGGSSYSPYSGSTRAKSKKEKDKENSLFKSILKKAGITAGLYGLGGGFDETPMLDEFGDLVSDKWSVAKDYLGFGEGYNGPTLESIKKLSKDIMPETTKSLEKEEMMGSIDKSGKYSPKSIDKVVPQGKAFVGWAKDSIKKEYMNRGYSEEQAEVFSKGAAAQLVNEVGWKGGKTVGKNNYFNIKETKKQKGDIEGVRAYDKAEGSNDVYASYSSPEKGVAAYVDFLEKNPRYKKAGVFEATSAEEYGQALQRAGFATDPNYAKKIASVAEGKGLKQAEEEYKKFKQQNIQTLTAENKVTEGTLLANKEISTIPTINDQLSNLIAAEKKSDSIIANPPAQEPVILAQNTTAKDNKLDKNLSVAEKKSDSIIANPPAQEPVILAQNTTAKANEATKSNSSAPAQRSMNMADSKQSTNDNQPLGNVRDDDPLILSMQYSNLRTV